MSTNRPKQSDPDEDRRIFGQALRQLRNRAGLTQQQLAERAATDNTYISHAEAGRFGVGWDSVMRLLRAVNATPSELAAEIERQERQPED
jgi:transcriptional regulator with XRE-family HTH domain